MENKPILIYGRFLHPSQIEEIHIFKSIKQYQELILPNGKSIVDENDGNYILKCLGFKKVKGIGVCTNDFITSPPQEKEKPTEPIISLMRSASFLGLDTNWSMATCALQLQEVTMTLVAKRTKIKLDKANVERVLNKKIESLSFNDQYEAFSRLVKVKFDIEMPILTTHLRKMRAKVLHEGYNPKPEETGSIVNFTIGLLQKLEDIS